MKVLAVHNYYGSSAPSGENVVFELERALLEARGHDVRTLTRNSDDVRRQRLGSVHGALTAAWNPASAREVRRVAAEFQPDVVHVHNTFPLISPAIFQAISGPAARVLTLHNYRLVCPAAIPARGGRPCTLCIDRRSVVPALWYGCYRRSRIATAPVALMVALHRRLRTWDRHVDAFITLSEFQRDVMIAAGLPRDRVFAKPNFYPGDPKPRPWSARLPHVVFAGRLSEEKGVKHLLDAWIAWGGEAPELRILGDGPLRATLEAEARRSGDTRVRFLGRLDAAEAVAEIAAARLVVLPSVWFEAFPMVLREAFAFGTPAAVSDIGPLPSIVEHGRTGVVFQAGNARSLLDRVQSAWRSEEALENMSREARREYEARYTESANYRALLDIYARAIETRRVSARARGADATPGAI